MSNPVVTVAICMHNGSRYIAETLDSIFAQTVHDFEIVLVDDGSTDGSVEIVRDRFKEDRLRIIRQRQQTLRVARPVAVAHARGEFIAFIDHDDLWLPDKLERQIAVARAECDAALLFSNCFLVDAYGRTIGRASDQHDLAGVDLNPPHGHVELLQRGCFVVYPTAFARMAAVRSVGGFNHTYQYVSDYDLWLRLTRRYALRYIAEPLAKYRVHDTQFTQSHPEITLPEHERLLCPIQNSASYPRAVRVAIGDALYGQHRVAVRTLIAQRRYRLAARAAIGIARYLDRVRDSVRHQLGSTRFGLYLESVLAARRRAVNWFAQVRALSRHVLLRGRRAPRRLLRMVRQLVHGNRTGTDSRPPAPEIATSIWIDGSPLGRAQTGYFSLTCELIRTLANTPQYAVHVVAERSGRVALLARLGTDAGRVHFHPLWWRALHWSDVHALVFGTRGQAVLAFLAATLAIGGVLVSSRTLLMLAVTTFASQAAIVTDAWVSMLIAMRGGGRQAWSSRFVRFLWRRWPAPRGRAPHIDTFEVLVWRGRFRWRDSRRIAIIQDMTTRIHPELHTGFNVEEFDEYLGYAQRHAHVIATVSENSRRDIVDRIAVWPESVRVIPMPVHPQYRAPALSNGYPALYGITTPYVLCVGTREPRKNLRRLVRSFELLRREEVAHGHVLALVGPQGWDAGFGEFLAASDASPRVRVIGFVSSDHLPSLYHFASAVIYPSVYEGFGLPVLEAMASSAVVLASRGSSLTEVIGPDGIQFDPYDTEDIARALLEALSLPETAAHEYRRRCRARAEMFFERADYEPALPGLPRNVAAQPA